MAGAGLGRLAGPADWAGLGRLAGLGWAGFVSFPFVGFDFSALGFLFSIHFGLPVFIFSFMFGFSFISFPVFVPIFFNFHLSLDDLSICHLSLHHLAVCPLVIFAFPGLRFPDP